MLADIPTLVSASGLATALDGSGETPRAAPHLEQNLASSGFSVPHLEQNIFTPYT
jgi:hypothetical protein